jgi:HKD family nuclease
MTKYVLAEHLKEEIKGRKVIAALFHTFNFDSEFFENYLLPLFLPDIPFGDNKIQNTILWKKFQHDLPPITVYCDFHAKAEKGIHLNYIVRPLDVPKQNGTKPCYHPKHSYILLEDKELLVFTGSNNLTEAGWCSNLEGVNFFKLKSNVNFPRDFKDQLKYFNRGIRKAFYDEGFNDEESYSDADNKIDEFFRATGYTGNNDTILFETRVKSDSYFQDFRSFIEYIRTALNDNEPFESVEVISPYFPKGISLFDELKTVTECKDISFSIPFENTDLVGLESSLFEETKSKGIQWKAIKGMNETKGYRFSHAKVYQFVGTEKVFTIVGSVNFTNMAWKGVKAGGNYESAILYQKPKSSYTSLLESYSHENLTFSGHRAEENTIENREDVYLLDFILDWHNKTLEIINRDEQNQRGIVAFDDLSSISINRSKSNKLSEEQLGYLSNNPIIKIKPSNKETFYYFFPIHKNIEAKPLPENLNLNDSELLQLWMDLETSENNAATIRIIDKFIDRITDESGEIKADELKHTHSTLNLMATHLSGILKLKKKIFTIGRTITEQKANKKMRDYYLFTDNVDTLLGYRNLIAKMANDGKLNGGFYWLLLNCIEMFFYKNLNESHFDNELDFEKVKDIRKKLKAEIAQLSTKIIDKRLTEKHLKWTLKMLKNDLK